MDAHDFSHGLLTRDVPRRRGPLGELVAEDDLVSFEGTRVETHEGEFWGVEPTDASITAQGDAMHRIRDGEIAETCATWDFLEVLRQIGAIELPTE